MVLAISYNVLSNATVDGYSWLISSRDSRIKKVALIAFVSLTVSFTTLGLPLSLLTLHLSLLARVTVVTFLIFRCQRIFNYFVFLIELNKWVTDQNVSGNKAEAARRIRYAYNNSALHVNLAGLQLNPFPPTFHELTSLRQYSVDSDLPTKLANYRDLIVELNNWTANRAITGNKIEAATRIRHAYQNEETILNLENLNLNDLPENILLLAQIEEVQLEGNAIPKPRQEYLNFFIKLNQWVNKPPEPIDPIESMYGEQQDPANKTRAMNQIREIYLEQKESLDLSALQLQDLPSCVGKMNFLKGLCLSDNKVTELPETLRRLPNLTRLNLHRNSLKKLPKEIPYLSNLTSLKLSGNWLKELPEEIYQLHNLTSLDLSSNSLVELPKWINKLKKLENLSLSHNPIEFFPTALLDLSHLKMLDLSQNNITNLPIAIGKLTSLKRLSLSPYSGFNGIPLSLANIPDIQFQLSISTEHPLANADNRKSWNALNQVINKLTTHQRPMTLKRRLELICLYAEQSVNDLAFLYAENGGDENTISNVQSQEDQTALNDWLIALSENEAFENNQVRLAEMVYAILKNNLENTDMTFTQLLCKMRHLRNVSSDPDVQRITSLFINEN